MITAIWNSALLVLWAAPIFFAVAVLFDNDFVGHHIYQTRTDGVVISAVLGGFFPLIFILPGLSYSDFLAIPLKVVIIAVAGATLYLGHLYYYFDVLFTEDEDGQSINDGASLELILNLSIIFIPLCAWALFDQSLNQQQWLGIFIILFAAILMSDIRASRITIRPGLISAIFLAAYILCEEFVYENTGIKTGFFIFSMVLLTAGLVMLVLKRTRPRRGLFSGKNLVRFGLAEIVGILAILFSHRALELNPVAFVVAVECFVPIFVALLSLVPTGVLQLVRMTLQLHSGDVSSGVFKALSVFAAQRQNFLTKTGCALIMAIGTFLLLTRSVIVISR